ncbi:uncharacterized protein NPIL_531791 [Nephila pilipes]|uniref:Uncharacterized protein n=1 Tax=Nephila pilipes TaxID=299642 RepID=A0A8X6QHJ7_NEPPI|nr:uncharacterized protein NPIL_531791 [Nephila pilipes]
MSTAIQTVSKPSACSFLKQYWKRLISGALLGSGGLGYCLFLNLKERNKWTLAIFIGGSVGISVVTSTFYGMSGCSQKLIEASPNRTCSQTQTIYNPLDIMKVLYENMTDVYFKSTNDDVIGISKAQCERCKKLARSTYNKTRKFETHCRESNSDATFDLLQMQKYKKDFRALNRECELDLEAELDTDISKLIATTKDAISNLGQTSRAGYPKALGNAEEEQGNYKSPYEEELMSLKAREIVLETRNLVFKLNRSFGTVVNECVKSFTKVGKLAIETDKLTKQVLQSVEPLKVEENCTQTDVASSPEKAAIQGSMEILPFTRPYFDISEIHYDDDEEDDATSCQDSESNKSIVAYSDSESIKNKIGGMVRELKRRRSVKSVSKE